MMELLKVASSTLKKWTAAPGTACIVKGTGLGGTVKETELAHPPGFFSRPPKGFRGLYVPISRRYGLMIGGINYAANINISEGETAIYSTDANGAVQSRIDLDASGNIKLNGATKRLVTYAELNTALQLFRTAVDTQLKALGQPGATLDISAAETQTVRTGG
jgi:hypothetical protein